MILGYLLLAEPKHIGHHPDKRNRQATSLLSPQQLRLWGSMVQTRRTKRKQRGNSPLSPYPIFHEGLKEQQSLWHEVAWRMHVQLWLMHVHAYAWMQTVYRTGRMPFDCTHMRLIVDRIYNFVGWSAQCMFMLCTCHTTSSVISLCAWSTTFCTQSLGSVQSTLKLRRSAKLKTNYAWTRRSIFSRLSPPAGPAPALYMMGMHKQMTTGRKTKAFVATWTQDHLPL